MTKTNRQIIDFINSAANYLRTHPAKNKFEYALTRVSKRAMALYENYNEKVEEARIDNCAVDGAGIILRDDRNQYKFSKDGLKKFNAAQRSISDQIVDIEPFIASEAPPLSETEKDAFEGFVIGPDTKTIEPPKPDAPEVA